MCGPGAGPIDALSVGMELERAIIWPSPSKSWRIVRAGVLVAASLTVTAGILVSLPRSCIARVEVAKERVMRLAFERYPQWRVDHPGGHLGTWCPERLDQIADHEVLDPWGRALQYSCDPRLLRTRSPGIEITSAGEDGVFGTSDDIRSDHQ